jgi:hypothetical protein
MRTLLAALAVAIVTVPEASQAQQACADRTAITDKLKASYGERFAGGGLRNESAIFEIWFSEAHGTWTILLTRPDGTSCVMAAGTDWRMEPALEEIAGTPS